jgi:hypothetical protein
VTDHIAGRALCDPGYPASADHVHRTVVSIAVGIQAIEDHGLRRS